MSIEANIVDLHLSVGEAFEALEGGRAFRRNRGRDVLGMTMRRDGELSRASCVRAALSGLGAMLADPVVDVVGGPDLALCKVGYGSGEVGAAGDLIDALPADSAEADADLMGADQTETSCSHAP